jgi:hypothetical protein
MTALRLDEEGKTSGGVTQRKDYRADLQIKNEKGIGDAREPAGPINVPFAYHGAGIGRVAFHPKTGKLWIGNDGGQNRQNISGNLPNITTVCIETEQSENRGLYPGTEFGVFFKDNTMTGRVPYGTGFPNVQVTGPEITEADRMLRAFTYGRGEWEIAVQNPLIPDGAGITEQTNSDEVRIYPNPGEGIFTLSANESVFINRILVVSPNGVIVNSIPVNAISSSVTFDVSRLASGVYCARVISDRGIRNYLFVKR